MTNPIENTVEVEEAPSYSDLVYEAFIKPIRNITVIDDDYPTLGHFLDSHSDGESVKETKLKAENIDRLKKIIELCHRDKNWSVDVFDGDTPKWGSAGEIPPHLNHSDLIVLDYHLDGSSDTDNGSRARKIICELESNNHFNIIAVHTNGYSTGGTEKVFDEILKELIPKPEHNPFGVGDELDELVESWLDSKHEETLVNIKLPLKVVLDNLYKSEKEIVSYKNPTHFLFRHKVELESLAEEIKLEAQELVKWIFHTNYERVSSELLGSSKGDLKWEWTDENSPNYISSGRIFISVIKKQNGSPEEELFTPLTNSLNKMNASPMHLLMAKMRSDIDDRGLEQANLIVGDVRAQSGWLYNLLEKSNAVTNSIEHDKVIDLHWEQLSRATKQELRSFSHKLVKSLKSDERWDGKSKEVIKHFFKSCLKDPQVTLGHLNALSCSQPVLETHLTTGSILKIEDDYWVCLTPACDLVPKQRIGQWESRIGSEHLVFKAVRLFNGVTLNTANENANLNDYIYLNIDGNPTAFTLTNGGDRSANPEWEVFYADNHGILDNDKKLELLCVRENKVRDINDDMELKVKRLQANVIAELRYEYALNLMHKFGANQTRVGLGFVDKSGFF